MSMNIVAGDFTFTDTDGTPLADGTVGVYQAGTSTLVTVYGTYADLIAETNPITNPVELDINGRANIFVDGQTRYKLIVKDSADVEKKTIDNVSGILDILNGFRLANGASIKDANGNELVKFTQTASAVNEITVKNNSAGNAPEISATGDDTNIDIKILPKGTGKLVINSDLELPAGKTLVFEETTDDAFETILTVADPTADRTITLPDSDISIFVVQQVRTSTGAVATGTTIIPTDDTIPQNTEGTEFMTLSITPKKATNILHIQASVTLSSSTASVAMLVALFKDSGADAIASRMMTAAANGGILLSNITLNTYVTAGSVAAQTYKIRAGQDIAGTLTFNGFGSARKHGGVLLSSIVITEYSA